MTNYNEKQNCKVAQYNTKGSNDGEHSVAKKICRGSRNKRDEWVK